MPKYELSRRAFIGATASAAAVGAFGGISPSAAQAISLPRKAGRLDDVEHVVILTQENRSFDHYYGTMRGGGDFLTRPRCACPAEKACCTSRIPPETTAVRCCPFTSTPRRLTGRPQRPRPRMDRHPSGLGRWTLRRMGARQDRADNGLLYARRIFRSSVLWRERLRSATTISVRSRGRRRPIVFTCGPA